MNCVTPTHAWIDPDCKTANGKQLLQFTYNRDWILSAHGLVNERYHPIREILVPCGKCVLCRKRRAFEIGIRARCEAVCYDQSMFITLTVSDDNMQRVFPDGKLQHRYWQLFAKRLRKRIGPFRYLMCGEYGEHTHRPHYHAIIFGHHLLDGYHDDMGVWHASKLLESCWPYGHVTADRVNDNRIMYVAGYVLKAASDDYKPYVRWSRRPGLGAAWFDKFWTSCYRRDGYDFDADADRVVSAVIWHGKLTPFACRYFDDRLALHDARLYDMLKVFRTRKVGASAVGRSSQTEEILLQGLSNKVELYERRLASRTRDLMQADFCDYKEVDDEEDDN